MDATVEYPRLIRRVQAVLVDSLLFTVVVFSWWGMLPAMEGLPVYIKAGYPIFGWFLLDPLLVTLTGATIGHHLRGLRVQRRRTPYRLGIIRSVVRAVLKVATGWWSFIFVLATQKHQALHDLTVGSVVVLKNPKTLAPYERLLERSNDSSRYYYPSWLRRIIVIIGYILVFSVGLTIVQYFVLSDMCLLQAKCNSLDRAIGITLSFTWFFGIGFAVVFGWRCRLFGARKRIKVSNPGAVQAGPSHAPRGRVD